MRKDDCGFRISCICIRICILIFILISIFILVFWIWIWICLYIIYPPFSYLFSIRYGTQIHTVHRYKTSRVFNTDIALDIIRTEKWKMETRREPQVGGYLASYAMLWYALLSLRRKRRRETEGRRQKERKRRKEEKGKMYFEKTQGISLEKD
ncbi:hypothetical protein BDV97DRAFT_172448 [Delphinella strobiligena]|nr:hypothetical protein BDV97DRAFT_172448 [Delphinella strobiligena]